MIGSILQVAVLIVIPFTILGQVLARTGGADFFSDLAMSAMWRFRGGAAKIAVVGSALFGMISGSAVSNVLAVGVVTIPAMMKSGFSAYTPAAIESVGSTGGQLMPPVMGASAFIMAEFLQVSYGAVCIAAAIPAILYYGCLFIHVDLEAAKHGIGGVELDGGAVAQRDRQVGWHFLVPIVFLVVGADVPGHPAADAGKGRGRRHRAADRAGADLRLSRQAHLDPWNHGGGDRDRPRLARHHPDRRRRRHHGRDHEHLRASPSA